ncbi:MAG: YbaB/EbfC family nucleoid-associated protein [Phycisphaerales bacterium]
MFDNMKMLGAVGKLMANKDKVVARVKERLSTTEVTGESTGGAARATVSGELRVLKIELSPAFANGIAADDRTRQLAGSVIAEAVNNAMQVAQQRIKQVIDEEAKAMGLPSGLSDMGGLGGLFGG